MVIKIMVDEIEESKIYGHWYITMIYLNSLIDESKVSKHPIPYQNAIEFKNARINSSKMNDEPMIEYWEKRI